MYLKISYITRLSIQLKNINIHSIPIFSSASIEPLGSITFSSTIFISIEFHYQPLSRENVKYKLKLNVLNFDYLTNI